MTAIVNDQSAYFHRLMEQTEGKWKSYRTNESLKTGKKTRVSNTFEVILDYNNQHLLEDLHQLSKGTFPYVIQVSWMSHDMDTGKLLSEGSILMGYHDGYLYRERGYINDLPVISKVQITSPEHMLIRTSYEGIKTLGDEITVAYEENFRWAGDRRLRSVLAWNKQNQLTFIGQYMEQKLAA